MPNRSTWYCPLIMQANFDIKLFLFFGLNFSGPAGHVAVLSDQGKRSMYDAGFLDLFEEDEVRSESILDIFLVSLILPT